MAVSAAQALNRISRRQQRSDADGALARALSRGSDALVTGVHQLRPTYRISDVFDNTTDEENAWLNPREAVAAVDASEAATVASRLEWAGAVRLFWKNAVGGSRTSIDVQPWVLVGDGVYAKLGTAITIAPLTEARIEGTSYRTVKLQVTALTGGVGNVDIYAGGEV